MTISIGIVGVGKIARDQVDGVPTFPDLDSLCAGVPDLQAITVCTPPDGRHAIVRDALERGLHVMLEKPPGSTLAEVADLPGLARTRNVALFATYHSREAPAVAPAKAWVEGKKVTAVRVRWLEDVRHWHPGQDWVWQAGGLGVFDPGINALSSLTAILPHPLFVTAAELSFPANRDTPIAARLTLTDTHGLPVDVVFDWRQTGTQTWEIDFDTDAGTALLSGGGAMLDLAGTKTDDEDKHAEYTGLYRRFADLVARRAVDFDTAPITLIADAFMLGKRVQVDAFDW